MKSKAAQIILLFTIATLLSTLKAHNGKPVTGESRNLRSRRGCKRSNNPYHGQDNGYSGYSDDTSYCRDRQSANRNKYAIAQNDNSTYYEDDEKHSDDDEYTVYTDDWKGIISKYEKQAENGFEKWHENPPYDWSRGQQLWFGGAMLGLIGFVICTFKCFGCCSNNSKDVGRSRPDCENKNDEYVMLA